MLRIRTSPILGLFFILLPPSVAETSDPATRFFRDPQTQHLFVSAKNCASANQIAQALAHWKSNLGETTSTPPATSETAGGASCTVDIENYAPDFVKKYQDLHTEADWGNCWGVALAASGMIPNFTQTIGTGEDIPSWMDPKRCKPVSNLEVSPGDIGAIRSDAGSRADLHGFVYVSPGVVFSKNSFQAKDAFKLQTFSEMLPKAVDGATAACLPIEYQAKAPHCPFYIQYYHCLTYQQVAKQAGALSPLYQTNDQNLRQAEQGMIKKAMTCKGLLDPPHQLTSIADVVYHLSLTKMQDPQINPSEQLLWKALYLRAQALMGSL